MAVDREYVLQFLDQVDAEIVSFLNGEAQRFHRREALLARYKSEYETWKSGAVEHVRGITEVVNEMCVARVFLEDRENCDQLYYEPPIDGTDQTIDFLVPFEGASIYFDVKTIHPEVKDRWGNYQTALDRNLFTENTRLALYQDWLGGEIYHNHFAARGKFLDCTLEFESKIAAFSDTTNCQFVMVFCGDGFKWHPSHLEDFADFYFTGRHRPDDHFGKMEAHTIETEGIEIVRTIRSFCYMERKESKTKPEIFLSGVRGPA